MLGGCGRASPRPKRNRSCTRWSLRSARAEPAATRVLRQCMCNRGCCKIRSVRRWEDTEDIIARRATGRGGRAGPPERLPEPPWVEVPRQPARPTEAKRPRTSSRASRPWHQWPRPLEGGRFHEGCGARPAGALKPKSLEPKWRHFDLFSKDGGLFY